jgi:serine/threonine protein kinase
MSKIVTLYGWQIDLERPEECFFVTEWMERGTLMECIKGESGLDVSDREYSWQCRGQKIALDIIEAIAWLHRERGQRQHYICHGDLK